MSLSAARVKKEFADLGIALLIFLLIQGALFVVLGVFPPYRVISSSSMEPVYFEGDVIFIKEINPHDIEVGDIIVFEARGNGIPIVHRVIDIVREQGVLYFVTKGDSNSFQDTYYNPLKGVPESRVIGTPIFRVPKVGWISIWLRKLL